MTMTIIQVPRCAIVTGLHLPLQLLARKATGESREGSLALLVLVLVSFVLYFFVRSIKKIIIVAPFFFLFLVVTFFHVFVTFLFYFCNICSYFCNFFFLIC